MKELRNSYKKKKCCYPPHNLKNAAALNIKDPNQ